jgi:outer membrane protein OmpA-like peptidoglycan-associated protein
LRFTKIISSAQAEYAEYDFVDADAFAERAMMAGHGGNVSPEAIGARDIPDSRFPALRSARRDLLSILARGGASWVPRMTARAQVAFDCWMQEQEENIQPADIAACRSDFYDSLIRVQGVLDRDAQAAAPMTPAPAPAAAPAPAPAPMVAPREMVEFRILFQFDSAVLTPANKRAVVAAAARAKIAGVDKILVIGHADRSGNAAHNLALSDRRAETVRRALIAAGVRASQINVESYGESQPAVATADGVKAVLNRRVTIAF